MDGHRLHYTLDLLHYAQEHNIIMLGYLPHCTHVLQGLDMVCFTKMKTEFQKEVEVFENLNLANVGKCYELYCRRVVGWVEYRSNLSRGSYQVRSESESELKSERDNYWKTIRLQLMCCTP